MFVKIKRYTIQAPRWLLALAVAVLVTGGLLLTRTKSTSTGSTFVVRRGPLDINVLVGGSTEALESQEIKCEVKGYQGVKILKIVEEGYQVTDDDVRTNKVLVELDAAELRKVETQKEIDMQSAEASLTEARQSYDIQLNQNLSDVMAAEQKAKFARMDFEKFMGDRATREIIDQLQLEETGSSASRAPAEARSESASTNAPRTSIAFGSGGAGNESAAPATEAVPEVALSHLPEDAKAKAAQSAAIAQRRETIDFMHYAAQDLLGDGESKQKIRKLDDDFQVAQKELSQAKTTLDGTRRLQTKGFVTKTELETDEFKYDNARLKVQTAETARSLFLKYEFPKTAEEFMSKFIEAVREVDRAKKAAVSKLAQAEAKLKSAEGRYNSELRQQKEVRDQLDKCLIRARKTGLVVYGGGNMMNYYGPAEQVREGALVREQQPIITIPNMNRMSVRVRIHESYIKKIQKGQKTQITLDAFPDKILEGEVAKVGLLPDSQNRWMNPDMNVYLATINIDGTQPGLKPGMSAKAEIRVKKLSNVLYVPIQAVTPVNQQQICYVLNHGRQERRVVKVGEFNDEFIEITSGLQLGDRVCLRAPDSLEKEESKEPSQNEPKPDKAAPAAPARGV